MTIVDVLLDAGEALLSGLFDPPSDRVMVAGFTATSLAAGLAAVLLADPDLRSLAWVFAIVFGVPGVLVSLLHVRRNEADRVFGICCLLASAGAPLLRFVVA